MKMFRMLRICIILVSSSVEFGRVMPHPVADDDIIVRGGASLRR